jgi:hypothetical protein
VRHIELNLIKIDRSQLNAKIFQNAKLIVQRLSASVFAIKISFEQQIIYQKIVTFLSDSSDKILSELRELATRVQSFERLGPWASLERSLRWPETVSVTAHLLSCAMLHISRAMTFAPITGEPIKWP